MGGVTRKTYTVETGYVGRDGKPRVFVKDHPKPLECDEPIPVGAAVVIVGNRAVRS